MNLTSVKLLIIYIMLTCVSCKQPCICDVAPGQSIEIKFINQQKENLIFGPTALYQIDSMQVLARTNFNTNNASIRKGAIDSNNVKFYFYIPAEKSYIYYNQQTQQDSIEIKWLTKAGTCCGISQEYVVADSVKFNNVSIRPLNDVYYFVK
jgi:hypothetical protein